MFINEMAKEYISNSLNNPILQWNHLARPTKTLADAVRAGREFLRIKSGEKQTLGRAVQTEVE